MLRAMPLPYALPSLPEIAAKKDDYDRVANLKRLLEYSLRLISPSTCENFVDLLYYHADKLPADAAHEARSVRNDLEHLSALDPDRNPAAEELAAAEAVLIQAIENILKDCPPDYQWEVTGGRTELPSCARSQSKRPASEIAAEIVRKAADTGAIVFE
jgi:hypothetical protein